MVRNNRILQAVCLFAALALLVIFCAVSVGAITPPIDSTSETLTYTRILGRPTVIEATHIIQLVNYQGAMGSFNTYYPSLLVYNAVSNSVDLYLSPRANNIRYSISNGVFVATGEATVSRSYFTSRGFYEHVPALRLTNIDPALVVAYRSVDTNTFVYNDSYVEGSGLDNANIQLFNTALTAWRDFYNKVYNYESNLESAEQAGYSDGLSTGLAQGLEQGKAAGLIQGREEGYETGFDDGYDTGYADGLGAGYMIGYDDGLGEGYETGFDDGYDTGYADGFDDGYDTGYDDGIANGESSTTVIEITENIDVGSIISALPEGAKAIIDGALGFEIFGINVAGTLTAILVVAIVGFVIKWLMTR